MFASLHFPALAAQNYVNSFSWTSLPGSSRPSSADPASSASSFPDDDDPVDVKKQPVVEKDTELDPFSLDDISTPGNRSEWAKTPLPSIAKSTLKNPGKYSEMERDVMGWFLVSFYERTAFVDNFAQGFSQLWIYLMVLEWNIIDSRATFLWATPFQWALPWNHQTTHL